MNLFSTPSTFCRLLFVSALCLVSSGAFGAATRHLCVASDANIGSLESLAISVPNSANCAGASYGAQTYTTSYTVGGCRGCGFLIELYYGGSASGRTVNGDRAYCRYTLQDGVFLGSQIYNDLLDTNNACYVPMGPTFGIGHSIHLMHGEDTVDLIYETDGTWNQGLSAEILLADVIGVYDDHGDITFDVEPLPSDKKSRTHARVSNPLAFPAGVLTWSIQGAGVEGSLGCTINPTTGEITAGDVDGKIIVRASASDIPGCFIERELSVGCGPCTDCTGPGGGKLDVSSVDIKITAGKAEFGDSAGVFRIKQDFPSVLLSTPGALKYYIGGVDSNAVVVLKQNGYVRQVFAPQSLANVVSNSAVEYRIEFYSPGAYGALPTNGGLYVITGLPTTVWTISNPDSPAVDHLRVTEAGAGGTNTYDYNWDAGVNGWELTSGGGARKEKRYSTMNGAVRTEVHLIRDGGNNIKFHETNVFQTFAWGEEKVQSTVGTGANALVTSYSYFTNAAEPTNYSRLQQVVRPGGNWEQFTYDASGRTASVISQFLDSPVSAGAAAWTNRVTTNIYSTTSVETFTYLNNFETSWSYEVQGVDEFGNKVDAYREQSAGGYVTGDYLVENRWSHVAAPFVGLPMATWAEDSTWTFYRYANSADGARRTNTVETGTAAADFPNSFVLDGTRRVTVLDRAGNRISETVHDVISSMLISSAVTVSNDAFGRPLVVQYLDGTTETSVYGCCGLESFTDREGVTTSYGYDYMKRKTSATRDGVTTIYGYDAAGNMESNTRVGTDSSQIVLNTSTFDTAGRMTSSTAPLNGSGLNRTTSHTETFDGSGHRVRTTTLPGGGTRVETFFKDGSPLSVGGTATVPLKFEHGVDSENRFTKEIRIGSGGEETEWTKIYTDPLGRTTLTLAADGATNRSFFNSSGQLWKQVDADGIISRIIYNAKGEIAYRAMDVDRNGSVATVGVDRLAQTVSDVVSNYGTVVLRTRTYVWPTNNNGNSLLIQTEEISADGLRRWSTAFGLTNRVQIVFAGSGSRTVTNLAPDGSYTVSQFTNGRLVSATSRDALNNQLSSVSYGYDSHRRQTTLTDARTGTTTLAYNDADQVSSVLTPSPGFAQPAQLTTNFFDALDRVVKTTLPDNTSVTNEYFLTGRLKKTGGSRTYPVEYTYDAQGRMKTMKTWQNAAGNGGAAVTTWNYDGTRGWLTNKLAADNTGPAYGYTPGGRLKSRTWARGVGMTNSYNNAGDLLTVRYSDGTAGLTNGYDRLGRQTVVTNGASVCTYAYNVPGLMLSESTAGGPLAGLSVTNGYDAFLRRTSAAINNQLSTINSTAYGYDAASRLSGVTNGTQSATYSYLANSPLVEGITFKQGAATRMTTAKSYDNLNRLKQISSAPSASSAVSFDYTYNSANQRTRRTEADNSYWDFGYDALGQLTNGVRRWAGGVPVAGQQFEYLFDDIGNRKSTKQGGDSSGAGLRPASYGVNLLNAYTNHTVPAAVDIIGDAHSNATVTVNLQQVVRQGDYFWKELAVSNATAAVYQAATNIGVLRNGTNADIITTNIGSILVAKNPETFTHDLDGNLTSDGLWTNTWNGRNELIAMESQGGVPAAARLRLTFAYDHRGRRVQKIVSVWNGSAYVAQSTNKFLYDGWNLLAELNHTNGLIRSYVWGLDLSGSVHGAGGVGGLLAVNTPTNGTHFACFDGNGNVVGLVNASSGASSATFEHDPFGNSLGAFGVMAGEMPLLFSTKYFDVETGSYYYGYRYMRDGRWMSRDPIEELGGLNLYGVIANDPQNRIDFLGLADTELHHVIPEWLARYSTYGARSQGFCIRLTTDFHRLTTGFNLESQLAPIRAQLQAGVINQVQAYNRVLMVQLQNLPAIIRNNRTAVGISGGSAFAFRGALQAGLAQAGYFTATEAALGATGIGIVAVGGYYLTDKALELGEYNNYNLVGQSEIDLFNTQAGIASRSAQLDGSAILSVANGLADCPGNAGSKCAQKLQAALNRNYFFIQTIGVKQFGTSIKQARDTVSEGLFLDYLQCLKVSGCCVKTCE